MVPYQLDGRLYGDKRVLKAFTWDGKTKYKVAETEEEERERLRKWDEFLEGGEEADETEKKGQPTPDTPTDKATPVTTPATPASADS